MLEATDWYTQHTPMLSGTNTLSTKSRTSSEAPHHIPSSSLRGTSKPVDISVSELWEFKAELELA
jgi:hypothetical protein